MPEGNGTVESPFVVNGPEDIADILLSGTNTDDNYLQTLQDEGRLIYGSGNPPATPPATPPANPPANPPATPPSGGTPPATPPINPPADPPAGDPPAFNEEEYLAKIFGPGRFKTQEEVLSANIMGSLAQVPQLETQLTEAQKTLQNLGNPWVSEDVARLNAFMQKNNIQNVAQAASLMSVDPESLKGNPLEILKLKQRMETGWNTPSSMLDAYIKEEYGHSVDDEGNVTWAKGHKMEIDAQKALSEIQALSEGVEVPDLLGQSKQKAEQLEQEAQKLNATWSSILPQIGSRLQKSTIGFGENQSYEHEFPAELVTQAAKLALDYAVKNRLPVSAESYKAVEGYMQNILFVQSVPSLLAGHRQSFEAQVREELQAQYHNGNPLPPGQKPNPGQQQVSGRDAAFEHAMNA